MRGPSFTFRLERVRALRERSEDLAKEQLAASMSLRLRGEHVLRAAEDSVEGARGHRRGSATDFASGADLLAAQAYLEKTERLREAAALDLDRKEAEVEARRDALQRAARDRQVLERLKDRRRAEHAREAGRIEAAAVDEMALTAHRRGREALA